MEYATLDSSISQGGGAASHSFKDALSETNRDNASRFKLATTHSEGSPTDTDLLVGQALEEDYRILMDVINMQITALRFGTNESTLKLKTLMYEAFIKIIEKHPEQMIAYLVHQNRNGGMQHKIFQEYANLLEAALPYTYLKGGVPVLVETLLDINLCIFDGMSEFNTDVMDNYEIENKTEEFYIGGRKGSYCKPFYIGKLLDVIDNSNGESLMDKVIEYSFFKIKMDHSVAPGTSTLVKHLRIPPHYQMGGMVYLNRIRRKIVDRVYRIINGCERVPSR